MVKIEINIEAGKMDDFKAGFLKCKPKTDPSKTDLDHFKDTIKEFIFNIYQTGKLEIAKETTIAEIDPDIIEVN